MAAARPRGSRHAARGAASRMRVCMLVCMARLPWPVAYNHILASNHAHPKENDTLISDFAGQVRFDVRAFHLLFPSTLLSGLLQPV